MYSTHLPFNYSRSLRLPQHEDIQQTRIVFELEKAYTRWQTTDLRTYVDSQSYLIC